jgi:hypothetical protein
MINLLVCCYCLLQFYYVFNSLCYQVLEHIDNNHMFFIPSVAKYWSILIIIICFLFPLLPSIGANIISSWHI